RGEMAGDRVDVAVHARAEDRMHALQHRDRLFAIDDGERVVDQPAGDRGDVGALPAVRGSDHVGNPDHLISSSSISKQSMPCGPPCAPLYASSSGIQNRNLSPTDICCRPSVQPAITPFKPNSVGSPLTTEESNMRPSVVQPV